MEPTGHGHDWVFERLNAFMDGRLAEEETAEIAEHIAECPKCQRQLGELRSVEAAYAGGPTEKPSTAYRDTLLEQLCTEPESGRFDPLTDQDLAYLEGFRSPERPVLSLYLDVRPAERQNRKYLVKVKSLAKETRERLDSPDSQNSSQNSRNSSYERAFQAQVEQIRNWLTYSYDETGEGLVIFSADDPALWRAFRLAVTVPDQLFVSDRPQIRPLLALADRIQE
jgi:hypothetical protein